MRISDWSSDVCSSDLRGGEGVAGEALVAPPIEGEAERPAAVDEAAAVETKAAHATPRSRFGSAAAQGPTISALSILCVTVSRSEEHTSELQLLMRISYAVFCLKKKNNNTANINTKHV